MEKINDNEEWIEVYVECEYCNNGRIVNWKQRKSGKPPWRYHLPCDKCKGEYRKIVIRPKYCQIVDCSNLAKHKCGGLFCPKNGWVCEEHWKEENVGFSISGYACVKCYEEIGSSGH